MKPHPKLAIALALALLMLASALTPPASVRAQAPQPPSSDSGYETVRDSVYGRGVIS